MSQESNHGETELLRIVKNNAGMSIFLGIVMLVMGLLAFGMPLMMGRSVAVIVGVLAVIAGVPQVVFAFRMGSFGKGLWMLILGVLTVVFGLAMIGRPLFSLAVLTIVLAAYIGAAGIFDIIWAFKLRPLKGWRLTLIVGIITLLFGIFIWRNSPISGGRVVGFIVGIRLIFSGWTHVGIGRAVRKEAKKALGAETPA
jgi:uncharacterized membrane protein HdeD (DUF308 family)